MKKKKVLIAGLSGQVATELVRAAPADVFEVRAGGRPQFDMCNVDSIRSAVLDFQPDLVVNAAAYTAVDLAETEEAAAFQLNAAAPGALAAMAAEVGAPIIHLSTDYVFDGTKGAPYNETDPVAHLGVYGRSKLSGEEQVARANPDHVILRTAWVYSPFGKNFVKTMLRLASGRDEVGVVHDQLGTPTAAGDIAQGIWSIAGTLLTANGPAPKGVFHMTGAGQASWAEFAETLFNYSRSMGGPSAAVRRITSAEYPTPVRRPPDSRLDCSRIKTAYGIVLPDWRDSARACVEELITTEGWRA